MIQAFWQIVVNPATFETGFTLKVKLNIGTLNRNVFISREQLVHKEIGETDIFLLLLNKLPENEVGEAFHAWRKFVLKFSYNWKQER